MYYAGGGRGLSVRSYGIIMLCGIFLWYELTEFFNQKHEEYEESNVSEEEERTLFPNPNESSESQSHSHNIPQHYHSKYRHFFWTLAEKSKSLFFFGKFLGSGTVPARCNPLFPLGASERPTLCFFCAYGERRARQVSRALFIEKAFICGPQVRSCALRRAASFRWPRALTRFLLS